MRMAPSSTNCYRRQKLACVPFDTAAHQLTAQITPWAYLSTTIILPSISIDSTQPSCMCSL